MTPSEVKGLQAIALRHGGSLTINPDTGLPEAGFLEQILPIVAAAGLTYLTAGAAAPTLTAALGGSTMAGGIAAGALSGAAISGGMAAIQGKDVGKAALMGGLGGGISGGLGAYDAANVFNAPNLLADASQKAVTDAGTQAVTQGGTQALGSAAAPSFPTVNQVGNALSIPDPNLPGGFISSETGQALASAPPGSGLTAGEMMAGSRPVGGPGTIPSLGGTGTTAEAVKTIGSSGSVTGAAPETFYSGLGSYGKAGVQSLPVLGLLQDKQEPGPEEEKSKLRRLSPNFRAYEPPRPDPYYAPIRYNYASGGIMQAYQAGGPVERMSMMNTAMNPQGGMYPQGMIDKTQYATPTQRPVSAEMVDEAPAYERSSPMLMAAGGQIPISLQGSVNLDQGNMASQGFSGAATVGSGMAPRFNGPMTGGPGMGPDLQNHMMRPQPAVLPGGPGGIGAAQLAVLPRNFVNGGPTRLPKGDPGLYRDDNPTTRGQDSFTAALTRLNERQKKANIKGLPGLKAAMQPLGNIEEAAKGGIMSSLGGYSDGGRMLKGPGDGMSDSIPASIANKQPARLADGEFVVPADVVSHLGNGSTDAGARKLYSMMDKIRKARTGKKKQAPAVKASRYMPA
jgi:hypothetical protein